MEESTPAALDNHQAFGSSKLCLAGVIGEKKSALADFRVGGCEDANGISGLSS